MACRGSFSIKQGQEDFFDKGTCEQGTERSETVRP